MKVHKEETKQKYKKIYVAKYDKQRRHQSLPSLSSNVMALRAGCDDKWECFQTSTKVIVLNAGHRATRVT